MTTPLTEAEAKILIENEVERNLSKRIQRILVVSGATSLIIVISVIAGLYSTVKSAATSAAVDTATREVAGRAQQLDAIVNLGIEQSKALTFEVMSVSKEMGQRSYELAEIQSASTNTLASFYELKKTVDNLNQESMKRVLDSIYLLSRDASLTNTLLKIADARDQIETFDFRYIGRLQRVQESHAGLESKLSGLNSRINDIFRKLELYDYRISEIEPKKQSEDEKSAQPAPPE